MIQGKRDSLILSFTGQGHTFMQVINLYKKPVRGKEFLHFHTMVEGDKLEIMQFRGKGNFTLEL